VLRPRHAPALQLLTLEELSPSGVPVTLLSCSGSLTGEEGDRLRDQLLVHTRHGPRHLLLDLDDVPTIDDVGVVVLVDVHRRARAAGCTFGLVAVSANVLTRLRLTGLQRVLTLHPTLEDALTALDDRDRRR